jgi:Protein of unknown function (DUF2442)
MDATTVAPIGTATTAVVTVLGWSVSNVLTTRRDDGARGKPRGEHPPTRRQSRHDLAYAISAPAARGRSSRHSHEGMACALQGMRREFPRRSEYFAGADGIHWRDLDEDLSVEGILAGKPSAESEAWFKKWLASRGSLANKKRVQPVRPPVLTAGAGERAGDPSRWADVAMVETDAWADNGMS